MGPPSSQSLRCSQRRLTGLGVLRIGFGLVWDIDAWFKRQPDFINQFAGYLHDAVKGQPGAVQSWIGFWINVVHVDPTAVAYLAAVGETAIAARPVRLGRA